MRSTSSARAAARHERSRIGFLLDPDGVFDALVARFAETKIDAIAVSKQQLEGSQAIVDAEAGVVKYDESASREEVNEKLAHELGHVILHGRLSDPLASDPVMASVYADVGPAAIARYSQRMSEEAEANAFALEYVCPSEAIFKAWRDEKAPSFDQLAKRFGVSARTVRVQLANALHDFAVGAAPGETIRPGKSDRVPLTDEQREAARATDRPVLVDAGPGTGKTATLIGRVEFALGEKGVRPEQILILTFSNEAAQELVERIAERFGDTVAKAVTVSTFHGLGMEFLSLHGAHLGFEGDPGLMDEDAQIELVYQILGRVPCSHPALLRDPWGTAAIFVDHINRCKQQLVTPDLLEEALRRDPGTRTPGYELLAVYREYEKSKTDAGRVDFADLISLPLEVLNSNAAVRDAWRTRFPWVMVDEFQDVSRATSSLLRALCGPKNQPWVVGDARQSIYRFLGASPENVTEFRSDFPEAAVLSLGVNYRSCDPVISSANLLADLMVEGESNRETHRWRRGSDTQPLAEDSVVLAEASSDYAEGVGITEQVRAWIEAGVAPGDIAVLARRHIDVRNTMLRLTEAGIKAQATGILTAEGAAGDLAAAVIIADAPRTATPRLAFALARDSLRKDEINSFAQAVLEGNAPAGDLGAEITAVAAKADEEKFAGDGWVALTSFLFESSEYLRRVLNSADTAERALVLIEIVSTLSLAAAYRSTHPGVAPRAARIGFGERLRARLTETTPLPLMPKPRRDTVRVMTCHAAKGLEFPCVIVSGQTVPKTTPRFQWLPASLRPATNEDDEQADSLLFVGVTRAKRALVVSWPTHAGESAFARSKKVVPLLERWRTVSGLRVRTWNARGASETLAAGRPVWGLPSKGALKVSALADGICPLLTYIESILNLRFPEEDVSLYPRFFAIVRGVLRQIVESANSSGSPVSEAEADKFLDEVWPPDRCKDHPHYNLYRSEAIKAARGFASAFVPGAAGSVPIEPALSALGGSVGPSVVLDLVAYFEEPSGNRVAMSFRPESYATKAKDGILLWSKLDENKRASFVLAEANQGSIAAAVYSGADSAVYTYTLKSRNRREDSAAKEAEEMSQRYLALAKGDFTTEVNPYACDRCRVRVNCPHWVGAL